MLSPLRLRHVSVKTSETLARAGPRGRLVVLEARVGRLNAAWRGVGVHDADINPAPAMHTGGNRSIPTILAGRVDVGPVDVSAVDTGPLA